MSPPEHVELVTEGHKVLYRAIAVDEVPVSASDAVRVVPAELTDDMVERAAMALGRQDEQYRSARDGGYDHPPGWRGMARAALSGAGLSPADTPEEEG